MATCYSRRVSARNRRRKGIRTNPRTNERGQRKRKGTSSRGKKCTRVHSVEFQKGKGENEFREEALRPSALLSFGSNKRPLRWLINGLTGREVGTIAFPLNLGQCPNAPSDESINSCSPAFLFLSSLFSFFLFFPSNKSDSGKLILTHPAFKLAFVVLSPLMNPLLRKNRRAKKKKKKDTTMKMESFTGIGTLQKASIERRSVGWGYRGHAVASSWQGFTTGAGTFDAWKHARSTKCALACTRHSCARAVLCSANVER